MSASPLIRRAAPPVGVLAVLLALAPAASAARVDLAGGDTNVRFDGAPECRHGASSPSHHAPPGHPAGVAFHQGGRLDPAAGAGTGNHRGGLRFSRGGRSLELTPSASRVASSPPSPAETGFGSCACGRPPPSCAARRPRPRPACGWSSRARRPGAQRHAGHQPVRARHRARHGRVMRGWPSCSSRRLDPCGRRRGGGSARLNGCPRHDRPRRPTPTSLASRSPAAGAPGRSPASSVTRAPCR